ncbi:MAG: FAD/NAD(P)-binding protein [Thermodesulfovibrionales bacterium]|jgi:all-trans-retinol 13,14-reductase
MSSSPSPVHGARRNEKYDVVLVGSGMGGLSVAALLAKQRNHVLVIEQLDKPGGCISWERHGKHDDGNLELVLETGGHDITEVVPGQFNASFNQEIPRCLHRGITSLPLLLDTLQLTAG